jgi:phosphate uptake regulator
MTKQSKQRSRPARRTRKISFRLSEAEYAQVSDELAICGVTISTLARKRLLSQRVASHADLAVLSELRRLGGLLKHIHNETLGAYSSLTAQAIRDLSAYARVLAEKRRDTSSPEEQAS